MLSLWKLRVGVEAYYLAQVASGLDEYYTGAGEAPGVWMGGGSPILGLAGEVAADDLRAVLAGLAPDTGLTPNGTQLATFPRRVPGFDLTFSVPKSVSVVYALGDPLVQAAVVEGCEAAVGDALDWLEREACFVRRGTNKAENRALWGDRWGTRRMLAEGFVAARFRHRTSRAGDPHLHWHVLVANAARGVDGRWSALDGTALYAAKRTAGVMFQAAMRRELTARLGVEWGPQHRDTAEIAGVTARVLREFSRRSEQIAEWMDTRGVEGQPAKDEALLATRSPKRSGNADSIEADWVARATNLGWGPAELETLLAAAPGAMAPAREEWVIRDVTWRAGEPTATARVVGFNEWLDWLLTTRLTAHEGTFTRFELTQAIAANVPLGTTTAATDALVQQALTSPEIVAVDDHWAERRPAHGPNRTLTDDRALRYSARSLIQVERQLLRQLDEGVNAGVGIVDATVVDEAITASTLGDDQTDAVRALTSAGDRVAVLVGRAGTGKTHTLGTLRRVYENVGWDVIGLAPMARAARELEAGAGITSTTIARHLTEGRPVTVSTVVVIDEAGTAGTRELAAIVDQATVAGAKVVLVGDHRQLPEVQPGGGFRAALDTLGDRVAELVVNRRQQEPWEQATLDELRHGDIPTALAAYRDHGRVVLADGPADLHALALGDWLDTAGDTLLLAGTRAETRLLNRHARQLLAARGDLDLTAEVEIGGRGFTVGDRVLLCRNHPTQHCTDGTVCSVDNGMRGTIVALDGGMTVRLTTGRDVVLDRSYLDHGWVDHGYALTVHKALGVTCDHVLVVGSAGLYRESAYVALSRARHSARLYATVAQAAELDERHQYGIPLPAEPADDPEADLLARLNTSGAKTLVTIEDPDVNEVARLAGTLAAPELVWRARRARHVEDTTDVPNPAALRADLATAVDARTHLDVGRRVRAIDRDNVGHVLAIDDQHGECTVHFEGAAERHATRAYPWTRLVVIDNPDPVEQSTEAEATLDRLRTDVEAAEHRWADALAAHGVEPGDADRYRRAVHVAVDRAAHLLRADPPEWLTTWLGPRPTSAAGSAVWDDATTRIAHHRLIHDVPEHIPALGPQPSEASEAERWQELMLRILEDRCWLVDHGTPEVASLRTRTPVELIDRQQELRELLATAPPDQRALVDRLVHSQLDPAELHEHLVAAMHAQDERRDWIIANWPHLVELEQINQLIATQEPLAHWPTTQPEPVRQILDDLRGLAPTLDSREERTLAELDRLERDSDPVRRLEARHRHLEQLAARAENPAECDALGAELAITRADLRDLRRARAVDQAVGQYIPDLFGTARRARIATVTHDALTTQPDWVIPYVRQLHDTGRLATVDPDSIVANIVRAAIHHDLHGQLPATWPDVPASAVAPEVPAPEIG